MTSAYADCIFSLMKNTTQTTGDILSRISQRETVTRKTSRKATMYRISVTDRWSARLYTYAVARRAVRLAKRLGVDAYYSAITVKVAA